MQNTIVNMCKVLVVISNSRNDLNDYNANINTLVSFDIKNEGNSIEEGICKSELVYVLINGFAIDKIEEIIDKFDGYNMKLGVHRGVGGGEGKNIEDIMSLDIEDIYRVTTGHPGYTALLDKLGFKGKSSKGKFSNESLEGTFESYFSTLDIGRKIGQKDIVKKIDNIRHNIENIFVPIQLDMESIKEIENIGGKIEYAMDIIESYRDDGDSFMRKVQSAKYLIDSEVDIENIEKTQPDGESLQEMMKDIDEKDSFDNLRASFGLGNKECSYYEVVEELFSSLDECLERRNADSFVSEVESKLDTFDSWLNKVRGEFDKLRRDI